MDSAVRSLLIVAVLGGSTAVLLWFLFARSPVPVRWLTSLLQRRRLP